MVFWSLQNALGGEIFVPKIPSYRITDVATAIAPNCSQVVVGIRPGEKIHEEMITSSDSFCTIDLGQYFAILPQDGRLVDEYKENNILFSVVEPGFAYNSGSNSSFLSVDEIRALIKSNIQPDFQPI